VSMGAPRSNLVLRSIFILGILNFVVFWIVAVAIGGDAVSGHRAGGHYYLANHGKLTEVSELVWRYSQAHVYSVWITHPMAILAGFIHQRASRKA
jgi:hypothetical protein